LLAWLVASSFVAAAGTARSSLTPRLQIETAVTPDFAGKTALITGAGRAIGRVIALGLADAGAGLILARSAGQLDETRAMLLDRGADAARIRIVTADLGDEEQRSRAVGAALELGRVDVLINNAATVEPLGVTAAIPAAELRRSFELNVVAPVALAAAALPGMLGAGWGRIVNVSSGIVDRPGSMVRGNAYAATKAALEAHTVNQTFTEGDLITPEQSAAVLIAHLDGDDSGSIWDVSDAATRI
jgi:NAD(P)-dependent dehydrogenase (short-subunit alcohol dehydrogenase family)